MRFAKFNTTTLNLPGKAHVPVHDLRPSFEQFDHQWAQARRVTEVSTTVEQYRQKRCSNVPSSVSRSWTHSSDISRCSKRLARRSDCALHTGRPLVAFSLQEVFDAPSEAAALVLSYLPIVSASILSPHALAMRNDMQ